MKQNILKDIIGLFYPILCLGCNKLLLLNECILCSRCRHELPFIESQIQLNEKFYGRLELQYINAILTFQKEGIVQKLIHHLKYKNREMIGTFFADLYLNHMIEIQKQYQFDYIIPVPLHPKKLKIRGYNQLSLFANKISQVTNIEVLNNLLIKNIHSETQTKKNLLGRIEVKEDIFILNPLMQTDPFKGKHFLLIDDVITTGTTLELCGNVLLAIPDSKISIIVMAASEY